MARERAVHERDGADEAESPDHGRRLLDRRSYLGLAGAAVASVAGVGAAGTAAAATRVNIVDEGADDTGSTPINDVLSQVHGDGIEVYFPSGEYLLDPIALSGSNWSLVGDDATLVVPGDANRQYLSLSGDGWTVDGFTLDLTAEGAAPVNYLGGTDWTFRNVEFVGQMSNPQYRGDSDLLYPRVSSSGSTGLIENVTATDGCADPDGSSNRGLTWFGSNNRGKMIWRGCHFANWANNTLYGANSSGPVLIEDCLFENTNVGVRIGGNTVVRNCVWKQEGQVPAQRWTGARAARGLWINSNQYVPGEILVEGCEFVMTSPNATAAIDASNEVDGVTVRNTRIQQSNDRNAIALPGSEPLVADGVSITGDSSAAAVNLDNRDGSEMTGLCIQQPGTGVYVTESANCSIMDSTVNVDGTAFSLDGSNVETSNVSRDGTCPVPGSGSSGGSDDGSSEPALPNTLTIEGTGTATNYEFTVDGDLSADSADGRLEEWDNISDATATGWVTTTEHVDSYHFSGSITDFTFIQGTARIYLNGEVVTPSGVVEGSALPRTVTLRGTGTATNYEFTVDGDLSANPEKGSLEQWDNVSDGSVTGWVTTTEHVDSYRFSGSITDFAFVQGDCEVLVDGESVDPGSL